MKISAYHISSLLLMALVLAISLFAETKLRAITNSNDVKNIGVDEKLGDKLPLELEFIDPDGKTVTLGDFFLDGKPVVFSLVYYNCPRLCSFVLEGMVEAVNDLDAFQFGSDYRLLSVSIDPTETSVDSKSKAEYLSKGLKDKVSFADNWTLLTGSLDNINALASSVGFRYIKDGDEFAHPSTIMALTSEGNVSRYLYGIQYPAKDFRLALLEASKGEIGEPSVINQILLYCYKFDPVGRTYAFHALNILKGGGVVTFLFVGSLIAYLIISDKKRSNGGLKKQP